MNGPVPMIVGRHAEGARLAAGIEADRGVAVVGEAGIGKTSLIRAAAAASGRRLFEGGGFATLADSPLFALRRAIGAIRGGDVTAVAASIERHVGPDLLFVDDLQWIDRSTVAVLRLLGGRIGLVVAIRTGDPGTDAAMTLADELHMERIDLSGIEPDAARSIVLRARPDLAPRLVDRVIARAGGNPLVLEEIAAHGQPSLVLARSIHAGLAQLSPAGRETLELLALIDRPIDRSTIAAAVDLRELGGFLVERLDQIEIRHVLIAEAIRTQLGHPRRRALHARAAELIADPVERAGHLALAGQPARAASIASAAMATTNDPIDRARLLVIIAQAGGRDAGLAPHLAAAAALAAVSDWVATLELLAPGNGRGTAEELAQRDAFLAHAMFALGNHAEARALLDRAAARDLDARSPAAGQVAIERAAFRVNVDGQLEAAIADLSSVLVLHSPDEPIHHAIRTIVESMRMLAVLPVDIAYLRAAVGGALATGRYAEAADLARVVNVALIIWEGPEVAISFVDETADRLIAAGAPAAAAECRAEVIQANLLAGRPAEAAARADELLESPLSLRARQTATIFRARALGIMGLIDDAARGLAGVEEEVTADFVGRGELLFAQADLAMWGGLTHHALELITPVLRTPSPIHGAYTLPELTRAWVELELGQAPEPLSGPIDAPTQAGAPFEMAGIRQLHAGENLEAAGSFAEAARQWTGFHAPRTLWCRWAEGEALRRAGQVDGAVEQLEATLDAVEACDMEVIAVRVRRSLRLAGRRLRAGRTPRMRGVGLTRREREMVELAGQGLTNAEIARRVGLGRPTVARILSNAMAKLGAGSRAQAVRLVADLE